MENRNDVIGVDLQVQSPEEDVLHAARLAAMRAKDLTFAVLLLFQLFFFPPPFSENVVFTRDANSTKVYDLSTQREPLSAIPRCAARSRCNAIRS